MIDLISNSMLMGFLAGMIFFSLPTAMLQVHMAGRTDPRTNRDDDSFGA